MIHFRFSDKDLRYLFLKFDDAEDEKWLKHNSCPSKQPNLTDHLNLVDPICYLKTYTGPHFTQDFLFEYVQPTGEKIYYCSIGLWQQVWKFFKTNNVPFDGLDEKWFKSHISHSYEEFVDIVKSWNLSLDPRDYQLKAAYNILCWKRSVSELATRAGKTLIAYIIFRYAMEYLDVKKILVIVPSISLVKQMYDDFKEYAEFFKTECIWAGGKLVESSNLTVGTFQSLIKFIERPKRGKENKKYNPDFFNGYDCVFVDETHRASAEQIKNIISQPFMKNIKIGFGMTGTLPKEKSIERYCIHSLLGAKIQEISTAALKEAHYISDIEIYQYRLHYKNIKKQLKLFIKCAEYTLSNYVEEVNDKGKKKKKELPKEDVKFLIKNVKEFPYGLQQTKMNLYNNPILTDIEKNVQWMNILKTLISDSTASNNLLIEKMMVHFMQERIDVLFNEVLPRCDKNTLLLAHHTEYVNYLTDKIKEKFSDTHIIVKITGSISSKKREEIKQTLKENNNCILIASYGTMSTGITLSNLCYGILFESFKSDVVNMQSIGRGLGLSDLKDKYRLFDFVDCFDQEITNKIFLQGLARIKIYNKDFNKHKYYIKNIDINDGIDEDFNSEFYNIISVEKENQKINKKKINKKENKENELFSDIYF